MISGNYLAVGELYKSVDFSFNSPVAAGQAVSFKVYTDNSYYAGPYAESFCLCLTPSPVPEPSSLLALGASLIGLAGFTLRRRG